MISCDENAIFFEPVKWVFNVIKKAYGIDIAGDPGLNVKIGINEDDQIQLSASFFDSLLLHKQYEYQHYFTSSPIVLNASGKPDYISSIFYLINGFQEYNLPKKDQDKYGRLQYKKSLQSHFDILEKDVVKEYVQFLLFQIDDALTLPKRKSRIFLSHDIDSVYGSLKYDGLWALKNGKLLEMMNIIFQTLLRNPPWFNIDKVASIESTYDVKACYYWIVKNGRSIDGIKNGDYTYSSPKIQSQLKHALSSGNEMGLHKSSMPTGFKEELSAMPIAKSNRYHFLKIVNPQSFSEMEKSGIQSDSSIGFPYHMGFKNSFGMPFQPFDVEDNRALNILEIPLQIMDGMFRINRKEDVKTAFETIVKFIEDNATDTVLSILWHNSEMTNYAYKWSFECYRRLLHYFADRKFETILPSQLVKEYDIDN